jgi:hypothetical protein
MAKKPKISLGIGDTPTGILSKQPDIADQYNIPMPNVSAEGGGFQMPKLNMGLTLPTYGGELGLDTSYQQLPNQPTDWRAMLGYRRRF